MQGPRELPPIPPAIELPEEDEQYCDMDDQEYEEIEIPRFPKKAVHQQEGGVMRPNSGYMKKIVARAVSLIDYRPGPQDPQGSLKLKVQIGGSWCANVYAADCSKLLSVLERARG